MQTFEFIFTHGEVHELITALHRHRSRLGSKINYTERKIEQEGGAELKENDPARYDYLTNIVEFRIQRIATINKLLEELEKTETI